MSVARYQGEMKDSGIEWIGEIPKGWSLTRIKNNYNVITGFAFNTDVYSDIGIPLIRMSNIKSGRIDVSEAKKVPAGSASSLFLLNQNDVLIGLSGSIENYAWIQEGDLPLYLNQRVGCIRSKTLNVYANRFVYYFVQSQSYKTDILLQAYGTAQLNISPLQIGNLALPLPPLSTQQLIATYLDRKTQAIDALITAREEQIARLQEKRASLIHRAVTKGITEGVEMKDSGIEWIGEIPKHWATLRLGLATSQNKRNNKGMVENNVLSLSYGRIKKRNVESNMGLLPASFETYQIVEEEDLIFRLTDLQNDKKSLRVGRATQRGIITSAYLCLRCRSFADSQYFYLLLHDYDLAKVFYSMGGGVRQSLTYSEFAILPVVLPPLDEQKRIASYVFTKRQQIDSVITALKESITTLKEYRQSLITEAVTGKLDPQAMQAYLEPRNTRKDTEGVNL